MVRHVLWLVMWLISHVLPLMWLVRHISVIEDLSCLPYLLGSPRFFDWFSLFLSLVQCVLLYHVLQFRTAACGGHSTSHVTQGTFWEFGNSTSKGCSHVRPTWYRKNAAGSCLRRSDQGKISAACMIYWCLQHAWTFFTSSSPSLRIYLIILPIYG